VSCRIAPSGKGSRDSVAARHPADLEVTMAALLKTTPRPDDLGKPKRGDIYA